ncbi:methyl-accepting chemotaxis protein [Polyangium jinanense]|uniref:Methyl-accepting chemotaxis protein n=1 Tax=Polyangium jinanense TaxID=2829994 RepID=A0A9X3X512_9BACT|nr:methyl-accepting chemotaxis protein [Polyangium jinanense]MDC3955250.1 methyl-accepting chemotaxis protein [Polyangium jinanense]MDC3981551.1 methyl-accepting chemotaxis protein [Polyangium jinanense]
MNLTIRGRMLAGFLAVTILSGVLGIVSVYEAGNLRNVSRDLAENTVPSVDSLGLLNANTSDLRLLYLSHIDSTNEGEMGRIEVDVRAMQDTIDKRIQEYGRDITTDEERKLLDAFVNAHRAHLAEAARLLAKSRKNENEEARKDFFAAAKTHYDVSNVALDGLLDYNRREAMSAAGSAQATYTEARNMLILVIGFVLAVAVTLAFWLSGTIAAPISRLVEVFRRMAGGDTAGAADELKLVDTATGGAQANDEVGTLVTAAREMTEGLRTVTKSLREGVARLSSNATQISATAKEYAGTASEQASAVTEVSTTVEEMKQTSEAAAASAREVAQISDEAAKNGHLGRDRLFEAMSMMQTINERVAGIASQILQLSEQTSQIATIVDAVSDLAEQSNLLAVNASIEAAKAGEQGRGFSVVASEVRSLAEQSKRATQQIRGILAQIQKATQSAVMATEEGTKRCDDGRRAVEAVRDIVENLAVVLSDSASRARQIAGASAQQASGVAQIASALGGITKAARDNATGVRQLEGAVVDIERLSLDLKATSDRF